MTGVPAENRFHIGFSGKRNAGKSSLVNAVTGRNLLVVSEQKGTLPDFVYRAMGLFPLGPVLIIDTPGFDDEGSLGEPRVCKTKVVFGRTDAAALRLHCCKIRAQDNREGVYYEYQTEANNRSLQPFGKRFYEKNRNAG